MASTMRWMLFAPLFLLGCATAEEPFSTRFDAASDTSGLTTEDSAVGEDSATSDTAAPPVDSAGCKLLINEVQTGDGTTGSADFVEIFNACSSSAAIGDYKLVYHSASGTTDITLFTFPSGTSVPANGYLVLAGSGYTGSSDGNLASGLATGGASVALQDGSGAMLDSMGYGTGTGTFVEGSAAAAPGDTTPAKSLSRVPNGSDTNDNASDFKVGTPTPGAANLP